VIHSEIVKLKDKRGVTPMSFQGSMTDRPETCQSMPIQPTVPVYDARRLVSETGTAMIVLDDKTYTLRITRAGKLILTK